MSISAGINEFDARVESACRIDSVAMCFFFPVLLSKLTT
jgi:hypothetical protein